MAEPYGVWKGKSMYGQECLGVERTTLLMDSNCRIARIWNKVKPASQAVEVDAAVKDLA